MNERTDFSLYDLADWFWSYRFLALGLLAVACLWTALMVLVWTPSSPAQGTERSSTELRIEVFAAGTPIRSSTELADILGSRLENDQLRLVSPQGSAPIIFVTETEAAARLAISEADAISAQLVNEVKSQSDLLQPLFQRGADGSEAAVTQYLRDLNFLHGVQSGFVKLLNPSVRRIGNEGIGNAEAAAAPRLLTSNLVRFLLPWFASAAAFILISGGATFLRGWRNHRSAKSTSHRSTEADSVQ